jgi:tagaturonate reductase
MRETILQFGAGNFLRGFVDVFVDEMNAAGKGVGGIVVVQSTGGDRARLLAAEGGRYHVVTRGLANGAAVDRTQAVASISRAIEADTHWNDVLEFARSPYLRMIVSNTTEAGLALDDADRGYPERAPRSVPPVSFPAKLLAVLRSTFEAGEDDSGPLILPCELVDNNAERLLALVLEQAEIWGWHDEYFTPWLRQSCAWANTLVDRIVSGRPASHPLLDSDPLLTVAEPYQFWAVEDHPATAFLDHPAIRRVPDVRPFGLRKVRILNGAHTALLAHVRKHYPDIAIVRDAVTHPEIAPWLNGLLFEEIVPVVQDRVPDAEAFARQTLERFANPYLDHKFESIALHHETKVRVRLVPTRDDYRRLFGKDPARLQAVLNDGQ